ncbi:MAG: energy-dependent translational throttle protein EttA [Betaproteobacteria bacterium RIFCSPLOWO2_12_FULL_62_58]|nr:MAG: energy-dependent translational throttle protein EttA [Betaproteobacteria bacterium RIFCSPLOWO2_12_FULL_62_58]
MAQYVYTMRRVGKVVPPKRVILKDISLSFFPGAKIGVLGLNGSGKSSLLKIMAGVDTDFEGEAVPMPDMRVGFLPQEPRLDPAKDVRGNVEEGVVETMEIINQFNAISDRFAEPMEDEEMNRLLEQQGELQAKIDAVNGWELDRKLEVAADALRLPPWDADVTKISGGERRRVALCRLLLSEPDMLLLDEPTNHLDALSVQWLEQFLERYPGTVIAVTHDRYFLDNVAGWILELDRGYGIPWEGNYSSWLEQKEQRLEIEAKQESARIKTMQQELEWVRANPKARQAKSKARLARFEELASQETQKRNETNEIYIPPGPHLGGLVIEAEGLKKSFGGNLLFDGLSFRLPPGGIVGVIGPNGAGKTTLFRVLMGREKLDAGTLRVGETVKLACVDQSRDALDAGKNVWEEISDGLDTIQVGNYSTSSRGYVARFNFKGADQQKPVGELSGGERNRVHLAKVLKSGGNVLLLDEPTNDLDVETLRALEQALLDFPGCAVVISHDRWFLDRIATHMLAFEGDSQAVWFEGNYADYLEDRRKRLGDDADKPHRIRYKPLLA